MSGNGCRIKKAPSQMSQWESSARTWERDPLHVRTDALLLVAPTVLTETISLPIYEKTNLNLI